MHLQIHITLNYVFLPTFVVTGGIVFHKHTLIFPFKMIMYCKLGSEMGVQAPGPSSKSATANDADRSLTIRAPAIYFRDRETCCQSQQKFSWNFNFLFLFLWTTKTKLAKLMSWGNFQNCLKVNL